VRVTPSMSVEAAAKTVWAMSKGTVKQELARARAAATLGWQADFELAASLQQRVEAWVCNLWAFGTLRITVVAAFAGQPGIAVS
jgi:hypothetical protein